MPRGIGITASTTGWRKPWGKTGAIMRDLNMRSTQPTRRDLLIAAAAGAFAPRLRASPPDTPKPVVGIVKIRNGKIDSAVEQAIELLGGMRAITLGKERIMLKPNLVGPMPNATTKPVVIRTLARLMKPANKEMSLFGGGAAGAASSPRRPAGGAE